MSAAQLIATRSGEVAPGGLGGSWVQAMAGLALRMTLTLSWTYYAIAAGIETNQTNCAVTTSGSDEVEGLKNKFKKQTIMSVEK